jgi:hypothetical protein
MRDDDGDGSDGAEARATAHVALPGTPERRCGTRRRRGSARYLSDALGSDDDEDGEALLDVGAVEERDGYDSGSDYEEAGRRGGAGGAPAVPARLQRPPGARAIKALSTDPHVLSPQRKCPYGCGALVWPEEGTVCCSAGKHILGAEYNPPIDDIYLQILTMEHVSKDSRHLNAGLAMGTQGIFPSKAVGGLGWHEQGGWSHLSLFGTTYCRMFPLSANNAFDNHLLPNHLLLDGATKDLGKDYAERLLRTRAYLRECHPLASSLCAIADVPGERVDLTPFMRIEAQSLRSSAMELAFVSSGVRRAEDHGAHCAAAHRRAQAVRGGHEQQGAAVARGRARGHHPPQAPHGGHAHVRRAAARHAARGAARLHGLRGAH